MNVAKQQHCCTLGRSLHQTHVNAAPSNNTALYTWGDLSIKTEGNCFDSTRVSKRKSGGAGAKRCKLAVGEPANICRIIPSNLLSQPKGGDARGLCAYFRTPNSLHESSSATRSPELCSPATTPAMLSSASEAGEYKVPSSFTSALPHPWPSTEPFAHSTEVSLMPPPATCPLCGRSAFATMSCGDPEVAIC